MPLYLHPPMIRSFPFLMCFKFSKERRWKRITYLNKLSNYTQKHTRTRTHTRARAHTHTHTLTHTHTRTHAHTRTHTHTRANTHYGLPWTLFSVCDILTACRCRIKVSQVCCVSKNIAVIYNFSITVEIIGCIKRALWFLSAGRTEVMVYVVHNADKKKRLEWNFGICFWARTKESSAVIHILDSCWVVRVVVLVRLNAPQLQWSCL